MDGGDDSNMDPLESFSGKGSNLLQMQVQQQQLHFTTLQGRGQQRQDPQHQQRQQQQHQKAGSSGAEIDFDFKTLANYLTEEGQYGAGGENLNDHQKVDMLQVYPMLPRRLVCRGSVLHSQVQKECVAKKKRREKVCDVCLLLGEGSGGRDPKSKWGYRPALL